MYFPALGTTLTRGTATNPVGFGGNDLGGIVWSWQAPMSQEWLCFIDPLLQNLEISLWGKHQRWSPVWARAKNMGARPVTQGHQQIPWGEKKNLFYFIFHKSLIFGGLVHRKGTARSYCYMTCWWHLHGIAVNQIWDASSEHVLTIERLFPQASQSVIATVSIH